MAVQIVIRRLIEDSESGYLGSYVAWTSQDVRQGDVAMSDKPRTSRRKPLTPRVARPMISCGYRTNRFR